MAVFARTRERQGLAQDVTALQQFLLSQQGNQLAGQQLSGLAFPTPRSTAGANLFGDFLLQQQQAAALRQPSQPFTLTPGAQRFTAGGQPIAQVPVTPQARAGNLQIAKTGDKTGLPLGTVFQADPQGNINIITRPEALTIDEQRKRDLIAAGIKPKAISKIERQLLHTQIAKNRVDAERQLRSSVGVLTPEQKISQTNVFRKEFDALSSDFRKIRDSFQRINAAAADPSAAGDLAIIFNFMKILDPGSVVRESEFATAENAAGVPDKIRNMWNKALTGERITFNRNDFVNQAANLFKAQQKTQTNLIDRYTKLSNRFGLNAQNVITETNIQTNTEDSIDRIIGGQTIPERSNQTDEQLQIELDKLKALRDLPPVPPPKPLPSIGLGGIRF